MHEITIIIFKGFIINKAILNVVGFLMDENIIYNRILLFVRDKLFGVPRTETVLMRKYCRNCHQLKKFLYI